MIASLLALPLEVPVDPDAEEARRLLLEELSGPEYQAARPNWFDYAARAFFDWIGSLLSGSGAAVDAALLAIIIAAVVVVVVVIVIKVGMPRLRHRSSVTGELFGLDEVRSAKALEAAADQAARNGDWALAIQERFRALARMLEERTLVRINPGMTARGFATRASRPFPGHADELLAASEAFDEVRYLGSSGTAAGYESVTALALTLRRAAPHLEQVR